MTLARKLLASLTTIAAAAGLMAFGTLGAFEDTQDYFPASGRRRSLTRIVQLPDGGRGSSSLRRMREPGSSASNTIRARDS
ncbi:hypothetical protein FHU33_3895 [Blastococcus colisei]|uniref:Uncharacterized protein n=1 Tax=Blastococcus colisei TaxID=1564162 RepID=A0A543PK18_9ACTN|nr:hypothetical protein FHU33_3895 [Blastococcus colisei]